MKRLITISCTLLVLLTGCSKPVNDIEITATDGNNVSPEPILETATPERVIDLTPASNAFQLAAQSAMAATVAHCQDMQNKVFSFISSPNEQTQTTAQNAFIACHQQWTASSLYFTEAFNLNEAKGLQKMLDLIDTRPYLAGYIDGIPEYPYSGLIHELELVINNDTLRSQHRLMDEDSASLGFPVIEFFLWKGPLKEHWQSQSDEDAQNLVNRRLTYLKIATEQLIEQLDKAQYRWRDNGEYTDLPDRAKFNVELKTLQRFTMAEVLNRIFSDTALDEPDWIHPAQFAGNGRAYLLKQLAELTRLIGDKDTPTPFSEWLDKEEGLNVSSQDLQQALTASIEAVNELPANFPFDTEANEQWNIARQQIAKLALSVTQLSQHLKLNVVTQ